MTQYEQVMSKITADIDRMWAESQWAKESKPIIKPEITKVHAQAEVIHHKKSLCDIIYPTGSMRD